ncbi:MAG: cobalt-precorrin-4/precorrin-4 C(11)-methyltransferase [Arcobacteraceae bacterium]|nr:cobalt-precorrin-4/precorrin-4 C(11)-methyltransferase [Arcobacteraceae bacterium]
MVSFVGAGCGDVELITVKGQKRLSDADVVLYTGSLVPKEMLSWCKDNCIIEDSQTMDYDEIFDFILKYQDLKFVRLHTGDPTLYSTIAKQIEFLKLHNISYEVIPGITAAFGASSSLGIEYTIPGVSQTLVLSRIEGKTPQPEQFENILKLKNSSLVFYLSISLIDKLKTTAYKLGYSKSTPCWVVQKATWEDEKIYKGTIDDIEIQVSHIKGIALILFGEFLNQQETEESHLYKREK